MNKRRLISLVCVLAGSLAIYGCDNDSNKGGGDNPTPSDKCIQNADCSANTNGKTECDPKTGECVAPVVPETCGNDSLDDDEECDGKLFATYLVVKCCANKKLSDTLVCNLKTCRIDLA